MPPPRPRDIRRFCEIDGWQQTTTVKRRDGDHVRFRKQLDDGRILRTRVSHGNDEIGDPGPWKHIWHEQLALDDERQFWDALKSGTPVDRSPVRVTRPTGPSLPASLAGPLSKVFKLSPAELSGLTEEQAAQLLARLYSERGREGAS